MFKYILSVFDFVSCSLGLFWSGVFRNLLNISSASTSFEKSSGDILLTKNVLEMRRSYRSLCISPFIHGISHDIRCYQLRPNALFYVCDSCSSRISSCIHKLLKHFSTQLSLPNWPSFQNFYRWIRRFF